MEADGGGIQVLEFTDSADDHLKAVEGIFRACGEPKIGHFDEAEIKRVESSITFLRQWRDFKFEPMFVNFSSENELSHSRCATTGIVLPQFSAAAIPKDTQSTSAISNSSNSSKDFIMYCGGPIWGLDWCPQVHRDSNDPINFEFLAVAAHPPGSSYHKLGAPLIGRGVIQIWCLLNDSANKGLGELPIGKYRAKGRGIPRKNQTIVLKNDVHGGSEYTLPKRPVGRPRKNLVEGEPKIKRPRGRPRKMHLSECTNDGEKSKSTNELPKSKRQRRNKNNKQTESLNAFCTYDSVNVLHNDDCNQAIVPYSTEQIPQPVVLDNVSFEQSSSQKSGKKMAATLHSCDLPYIDDFVPIRAIKCNEDDSELSLLLNRATDRSTQPIKVYVRRHKLNKTVHGKDTVEPCENQPEQSMTHSDDVDYVLKAGLGTNDQRAQYSQQEYASEELSASRCSFQHEKEYDFEKAKRKRLSGENAANIGSWTQNTNDLARAIVDPLSLHESTLAEEVVNCSSGLVIPRDIALPRLVLCLAHNGKVVWDVKWRPPAHASPCRLRMGFLAVLLGNGYLEVWDVPLPNVVCDVFSSSRTEGTDPRFMKLKPVFKSSKLKFRGRESIPLTVEWSASFPHDLLLAGCHDGTVAVWKFSEGNSCEDSRPLLCFRADTSPIRAVSWAPTESEGEDSKVIVTAGHTGLKFWDMRDPFHPLWTFPLLRIHSLDWMPNPRCVIISSDDGSLKLLGISEISDDQSVTGQISSGSKLQGLHTFACSTSAIWSIHISRVTGMAAYCSADGTVVRFQLTTKAVEKDHSRHRVPHFLFGSLTENDSVLTVHTPPANTPAQLRKPNAVPQSMRALLDLCNQSSTNYLQLREPLIHEQTLAICDGNKSRQDHHTPTASAGPSSRIGDGESPQDDAGMVSQVAGANNSSYENQVALSTMKPSGPPPKILAMHRVRWNMNKGSERWLCSGGASQPNSLNSPNQTFNTKHPQHRTTMNSFG